MYDGMMVVTHTPAAQREVANLLQMIRQTRAMRQEAADKASASTAAEPARLDASNVVLQSGGRSLTADRLTVELAPQTATRLARGSGRLEDE